MMVCQVMLMAMAMVVMVMVMVMVMVVMIVMVVMAVIDVAHAGFSCLLAGPPGWGVFYNVCVCVCGGRGHSISLTHI